MDVIKKIEERLNRMEQMMQAASLSSKETLTLEEAAIYTGRSRSNLHKLTSRGVIPHSKPSGKMIYFNRHLLDKWMLQNPIKTATEIEEKAATYVAITPPAPTRNRNSRKSGR